MNKYLSLRVKRQIASIFSKKSEVVAVYIFGSYSKGKQRPTSDLDIVIACFDKKGLSSVDIAAQIQRLFSDIETDVSVVDFTDDPLLLIQAINGKLIYQKSLKERVGLETRILHLYEDSKHLRDIENQYLDKSFKEGVYAY